jgi:hypothetical protein
MTLYIVGFDDFVTSTHHYDCYRLERPLPGRTNFY